MSDNEQGFTPTMDDRFIDILMLAQRICAEQWPNRDSPASSIGTAIAGIKNLRRENERLQSELEAERAEVRELREAFVKVRNECDDDISAEAKAYIDNILYNTTAPNEAEIRAQRDREIADWLESKAESAHPAASVELEDAANELRQRADGKCEQ